MLVQLAIPAAVMAANRLSGHYLDKYEEKIVDKALQVGGQLIMDFALKTILKEGPIALESFSNLRIVL